MLLLRALTTLVVVGVVWASTCQTFGQVKSWTRNSREYRCGENCMVSSTHVFGTEYYDQGSPVCVAALHSGAINTSGGVFTITRSYSSATARLYGSARNRILSKSMTSQGLFVYKIEKTQATVTEADLSEDVVVVHNSYTQGRNSCPYDPVVSRGRCTVHVACLSQGSTSPRLVGWDFAARKYINDAVISSSRHRVVVASTGANLHAVACLGRSPATDVSAVIQFPGARYQSSSPTVRFSKGQQMTIPLVKRPSTLPNTVYARRLPDKWTSSASDTLPLMWSHAELYHNSVYLVNNENGESPISHITAGYLSMVVRECGEGRYGVGCMNQCPQCSHGGQCHPQTGTCVCPPGFMGDSCQRVCARGSFGHNCQLRCNEDTLGFTIAQDGDCRGLIICLPEPYGCSCAPGYTSSSSSSDTDPICTQDCSAGKYGADCTETCAGCDDGCDQYTGICVPPSPQLTVEDGSRELRITWSPPSSSKYNYTLTYQSLGPGGCTPRTPDTPVTRQVFNQPVTLQELVPFTHYRVCVTATNQGVHSAPGCVNASTSTEPPGVELNDLQCRSTRISTICSGTLSDTCEGYNGPNLVTNITLKTKLACNDSVHTIFNTATDQSDSVSLTFNQLIPGQEYQVTAQVTNSVGGGPVTSITYTTTATKPPPVKDLRVTPRNKTAVQLWWNDPCPSNGDITSYYVRGGSKTTYNPVKCLLSQEYERCYIIEGVFTLGVEYEFSVLARNKADWSTEEKVRIKLEEKRPGPPASIVSVRGSRQLEVDTIQEPYNPGGQLINCSLSVTPGNFNCVFRYTTPPANTCELEGLTPGKLYQAKAFCCNSKFCGDTLTQALATLPRNPEISGHLQVLKKTNSTITLHLPPLVTHGDGNSSSAVVVMTANHSRDNVEDEVKQLLSGTGEEEKRIHARNTRQAQACEISLWVAGLVNKEDSQFEIGDGKTHGGYYNCPLKFQESYYLGMMAVTELLGERSFAWTVLTTSERVVPFTRKGLYWIPILIVLLLIVIAVAVVACYMYWRRPTRLESLGFFRKGNSNNGLHSGNETSADSDSTHPTPLSPAVHFSSQKNTSLDSCAFQSTEKLSISEPTYENLATEEIYGNLTARVPRENVEAYLNMTIRSRDVSEEFKSVSYNYNKTTEAGQLLPNKHKNRYKNNLPNDDTRVILSTINDDPYSDYINANHVPGYGRMQYIASQGPKDANVSTIADFWRMIMEQKITAIIMVANFIEGGRNKVGEYFKPGVTLEFDGYYVSVIHREQLPLFTVSTLRVKKDDYSLDVKHYHYVSWPDHGIPDEAHSMAHMIKHFRSNVSQVGGTVVHCSAGIGRTGTTLQVLHMCEMLTLEGSFNPIEVLRNLRNSRARLVENEAQYNLSLEIFEEVLFGDKTKVTPSDLVNSLDSCLEESVAQFRKIKNLPSPATYKTSNPSFRSMVRNKSVLPADSRRIYLHMINGQPETQYINAVWIPGLNQQRAVIVTEHPLPATLPKFWRLVAEEKCPFVILINQFDKHSKEEFPDVMPAEGEKQTFGKLTVHVQEAQPYGNNLIQYIVNITESETIKLRVKVYQVLSWMFGQDEPPTPNILVTLAELLLESRGGHSGSPLLCCGNGVTSCGLVTAMSLLLEQLQNEQLVDVYRTVVKLLRSRPQFITSEAQYALLYRGVAEYIKNYSTYGNFQ